MPLLQSLLKQFGKTLLRSQSFQQFINQGKKVAYNQIWQIQKVKLNQYAQHVTNAAVAAINANISQKINNSKNNSNSNSNSNSNNKHKSHDANSRGANANTMSNKNKINFTFYQSLRLSTINTWYKYKSSLWKLLAANFIGIIFVLQILFSLKENMSYLRRSGKESSSSSAHKINTIEDAETVNFKTRRQEKSHDKKDHVDLEIENANQESHFAPTHHLTNPHSSQRFSKTSTEKDSENWHQSKQTKNIIPMEDNKKEVLEEEEHQAYVKNKSDMWSGNSNDNDKFNSESNIKYYTDDADNDGGKVNKKAWKGWLSKEEKESVNDTANEFDFTVRSQSANNNNSSNKDIGKVINNVNQPHNLSYSQNAADQSRASYLYNNNHDDDDDDIDMSGEQTKSTWFKTGNQRKQNSVMSSNEFTLDTNIAEHSYNDDHSNRFKPMFEGNTTPFLVKMDNETEFTSFFDRDEMTGKVKSAN